ncbi:hypothetical protein JS756_28705 [Streptomyces actuosus]|uniref:Nitroreductase domain-containing protein n=1 Tax=Streptomyces actuosus TaxID=1885 RepID=A0ABS2VYD6_STRAS|nr:hypothetical protein [Streptomyces actuosus]MBN0048021.1 hypothetical protein [Streptomyces actuosus]
MTVEAVHRFAYRQGPGKALFGGPIEIDDTVPTTALLPPAAARGGLGAPLPYGTVDLLNGAVHPHGRIGAAADRAGHLLLAAFGLQRREPSNRFNDHRPVASVRSKFPVHALTLSRHGAAYLDPYRHALVDLAVPYTALPVPRGDLDVVLAARYTDLPTPYGRLRAALGDLETGINVRSLLVAAELFGVRAELVLDAADAAACARMVRATGPGRWSAPVRVALRDVEPPAGGIPLPGGATGPGAYAALDGLLSDSSGHPSLDEADEVAGYRLTASAPPSAAQAPADADGAAQAAARPTPAVPGPLPGGTDGTAARPGPTWDRVLWNRTAGRVPGRLSGFSGRPTRLPEEALEEAVAWARVPAPTDTLAEVGRRVRLLVALQGVGGREPGYYEVADGDVRPVRHDPQVMVLLQEAFGYPMSPGTDCGLRHASMVWTCAVDVRALLDDLGPVAWSLLNLWCGWTAHGLQLAAAARGLYARPARSYDEFRVQRLAGLPRRTVPVFITVCGRSRFAEPMLDLRT